MKHRAPEGCFNYSDRSDFQSRCGNNAVSVSSLCEASVLGRNPVGWPWLSQSQRWITAQNGCKINWMEQCGRIYVCLCVHTAWLHVTFHKRMILQNCSMCMHLSFLCVHACVCLREYVWTPFRAPWESSALHSLCRKRLCHKSQLAILLLWNLGTHGYE